MPFIGNQPALSYTSFAVQHFTTSATTSYTLDHSVANENEIRLVINNVVQQPGSSYAYTASGTTLTLSAATSATDTMYAVFLGKAVQTVNPPSGSVDTAQIVDSAVTSAKIASGVLGFTNGTKVSPTGVSQVTFTGIPSTARMIVINTDGLSFTGSGNTDFAVRIGDSGGIETSGYKATAVYLSTNSAEASPAGAGYTDKFVFSYQPDQNGTLHAQMILTCMDTSTNTWNFSNLASMYSAGYVQAGAGVKSLSDTLTQVQILTAGGQNWDAGSINIMYI